MAKKTFRSKVTTRDEKISFEIYEQEFFVKDNIPSMFFLDLVASISDMQDSGNKTAFLRQVKPFFQQTLVKESRERFFKLLEDENTPVDINTLLEIFSYIMEETSNRPLDGQSE